MNVLAVIPAKASSSRVPGKNLRPLGGVPLFLWTVRAARQVQPRMTVVVSTDAGPAGDEIAALAVHEGAAVIRRPKELCEDPAQAPDVVLHALDSLERHGQKFDTVVMLLPTSPFRAAKHIEEALRLKAERGHNVVSVCEGGLSHKLVQMEPHGLLIGPPIRRWMNDRNYLLNGAIWIASPKRLRAEGFFDAEIPYVMDDVSGMDIDTHGDWLAANAAFGEAVPT